MMGRSTKGGTRFQKIRIETICMILEKDSPFDKAVTILELNGSRLIESHNSKGLIKFVDFTIT